MVEQRIVLIGAGSIEFGLGTIADILLSEHLKGSTVVLHDINSQRLQFVEKVANDAIDSKKFDAHIEVTTSRTEALEGADHVIISIEVGDRFGLWEQDYKIPLKYGSRQTYGENGGPGGLFHSLRTIPPIVEITEDINALCPDALIFNLSNPMSRICLAIHREFPNLQILGLCHEIKFLEKHLPQMLNQPFSNLKIKAGGLNHFGILLEAKYKDTRKDAYPDIRNRAMDYLNQIIEVDLIKEIFRIYDYLPYTTDSHFSEYLQWGWEKANMKDIKTFYNNYKTFCQTQAETLKEKLQTNDHSWWLNPSGERIVPIIEGILTDSGHYELSVNLPNQGLITNLPQQLIVESPATVDRKGVHGVTLGDMPIGLAGIMRNQVSVQHLSVEAALTGSKKIALQALLSDPVVDSISGAEKMLDAILQLQKEKLPRFHN